MPRRSGYHSIDPLNHFGPVLDRRAPVETCCCCCCKCTRSTAIYWYLGLCVFEAVWHISISIIRPTWEWNRTVITIFGFFLQNLSRTFNVILCFYAWRALKQGKDALVELRQFLRGLTVLWMLELFEICLKATEVRNICDAPEVWERRNNGSGLSENLCELVSDLYDYAWGVCVLLYIGFIFRMVHSHVKALGGDTWSTAAAQEQQQQGGPSPAVEEVEVGAAPAAAVAYERA